MNILVTGCAGFIGSTVARLLVEQGHTICGIDSLNDAYDRRLKDRRVEGLRELEGFEWHLVDVADRDAIADIFSGRDFNAVVNLAARAGVRESTADPWIYYETNVTGTINLLEQCRRSGTKRFVLASSSSVYGNGEVPFSEDGRIDRPLSPYASSKKAAEDICHSYHHVYGINVTALRLFTVYGPAGRPDMAMFRFIRWIAEGEQLTLFGDGRQRRDFTYIDDVARGIVAAIDKTSGFQVVNLGSDRPVEICSVIAEIEKNIGKKASIDFLSADPLDVKATWADISRARSVLGWEPTVSIEEGVKRTVDWYLQNRSWASELTL